MKKSIKICFILFIIISILFLGGSSIYYGKRLIHFYLLENGKAPKEDINLNKSLLSSLTSDGDGLYGESGEFYFYGKDTNNYILYSNRLFRILSIDIMGNIKIVSDRSLTSIFNGKDNVYINKWLKEYCETLDKDYIVSTKYCSDIFDNNLSCLEEKDADITLLTINDYIKAGDVNSFLNTGEFYFLDTKNNNGDTWYIDDKGYTSILNNKVSLGIRPVITIRANLNVLSGDGSHDNPYIVEDTKVSELKNAYIGSYVLFSDKLWRINKISENINLVLDDEVEDRIFSTEYNSYNPNEGNNLANYLNNEFYNSLDKDKVMLNNWYNGFYEDDYESVRNSNLEAYVGLNSIGDIFFTDKDIFTMNPTGSATRAMYVTNGNRISEKDINTSSSYKPVIAISIDTLVESGNGTLNNPYVVE